MDNIGTSVETRDLIENIESFIGAHEIYINEILVGTCDLIDKTDIRRLRSDNNNIIYNHNTIITIKII